jgi:c-di-GMP-binding flagellar brake protein YcgR
MTRLRHPLRVVPSPMEGEFLREVLDELDRARTLQGHERRKYKRADHRCLQVVLIVKESGGEAAFMAASRNISQGGVCLLHRQMLYPAERCRVVLPLQDNRRLLVRARVVRCRFIQGILHEIGLRFDCPIKPEELNEILGAGEDPLQASPQRTEVS